MCFHDYKVQACYWRICLSNCQVFFQKLKKKKLDLNKEPAEIQKASCSLGLSFVLLFYMCKCHICCVGKMCYAKTSLPPSCWIMPMQYACFFSLILDRYSVALKHFDNNLLLMYCIKARLSRLQVCWSKIQLSHFARYTWRIASYSFDICTVLHHGLLLANFKWKKGIGIRAGLVCIVFRMNKNTNSKCAD